MTDYRTLDTAYVDEHELCPICNTIAVKRCNCQYRDSVCKRGHNWWYHPGTNVRQVGLAPHEEYQQPPPPPPQPQFNVLPKREPKAIHMTTIRNNCPVCAESIVAVHDHGSGSRGESLCKNGHVWYVHNNHVILTHY